LLASFVCAAGCGKTPAPQDDATAQLARVRDIWRDDPRDAIAQIEALEDEQQQRMAVEVLILEHGRQIQDPDVCAGLTRQAVRHRCQQWLNRSHLYLEPVEPSTEEPRDEAFCRDLEGEYSPVESEYESATILAKGRLESDLEQAVRICGCVDDVRMRGECHFELGETLVQRRGISGLEDALSVCARSPAYVSQCRDHTLTAAAHAAPTLVAPGGDEWSPCARAADLFRATATEERAEDLDDRIHTFWASVWAFAFVPGGTVTPEIVAEMPPEALPHLRAGAAWSLVLSSPEVARPLEDWTADLTAVLTGNKALPPTPEHEFMTGTRPMTESRCGRGSVTGTVQRIPYLGRRNHRRALATDVETDEIVCLLQAMVSAGRDLERVFDEAAKLDDPALQWTILRGRCLAAGEGSRQP